MAIRKVWIAFACVLLTLLAASVSVSAEDLQAIPALTARVTDLTATLAASDIATLDAELAALERRKGAQIAVLIDRDDRAGDDRAVRDARVRCVEARPQERRRRRARRRREKRPARAHRGRLRSRRRDPGRRRQAHRARLHVAAIPRRRFRRRPRGRSARTDRADRRRAAAGAAGPTRQRYHRHGRGGIRSISRLVSCSAASLPCSRCCCSRARASIARCSAACPNARDRSRSAQSTRYRSRILLRNPLSIARCAADRRGPCCGRRTLAAAEPGLAAPRARRRRGSSGSSSSDSSSSGSQQLGQRIQRRRRQLRRRRRVRQLVMPAAGLRTGPRISKVSASQEEGVPCCALHSCSC